MPDVPPYGDDNIGELAAVADELKEALDGLSESVGVLSDKTDTNRRVIVAIGSLAVLKLITIVILVVIIVNMAHTNHRLQASIQQITAVQAEQANLRNHSFCPLYRLFLASVNDPATKARMTPDELKSFNATVKTLQDGYAALHCTS